jgi:alanine dehydrogenase
MNPRACASTSSRQPVFRADWLEPGTHITSLGPISEIPADAFLKANRIVVTSIEHEQNYFVRTPPFPLVELTDAKRLLWGDVAELGDIIIGKGPGRKSPDDITVFHESQGGLGDVAFTAWADAEARRLGLGRETAF